jgi:hypothetical protein
VFDPVTIAGTAALTEGIKFLYGQVTELLRRHREHTERAVESSDQLTSGREAQAGGSVALPGVSSGVLDGPLTETPVGSAELAEAAPQLAKVRTALADYADGVLHVTADDEALSDAAASARGLLEILYRQHLTLVGEKGRPVTGSPLTADEMSRGQQAIIASGEAAIAADTISGQAATTGGVNIGGGVHGGVHMGGKPDDGPAR